MFELKKINDERRCEYGNCKKKSVYELACINNPDGNVLRNNVCLCEEHLQELKDFLNKN